MIFDKANSRSLNFIQKLRSNIYLNFNNVKYGKNTYVKSNFEIRKSTDAQIIIGENCVIQEYVFFY